MPCHISNVRNLHKAQKRRFGELRQPRITFIFNHGGCMKNKLYNPLKIQYTLTQKSNSTPNKVINIHTYYRIPIKIQMLSLNTL